MIYKGKIIISIYQININIQYSCENENEDKIESLLEKKVAKSHREVAEVAAPPTPKQMVDTQLGNEEQFRAKGRKKEFFLTFNEYSTKSE